MRLILNIIAGPQVGQEIKLESGQSLRIGRTERSDFATHDSYMSGEHFIVECARDTARLLDLNSRNGTFLNKQKVTEAALQDGDQIYAGQTYFAVHFLEHATATGPANLSELPDTIPPGTLGPFAAPITPPANSNAPAPPATPTPNASSLTPDVGPPPNVGPTPPPSSTINPELVQPPPPVQSAPSQSTPQQNIQSQSVQPPSVEPPVVAPPSASVFDSIKHFSGETSADSYKDSMERLLKLSVAVTPEGRLLNILRSQRYPLFALLDAARESSVPELLRESGEQYQSLYEGAAYAASAPYLVQLPNTSKLPEQLIRKGGGQGWTVYLTCSLPLAQLRDYFRQSLMVRMPDGREFFSRFYDPRFFRVFLPGCTPSEAARFFGPISRYFMEAENPEILLQFSQSPRGVELRERLLLISGT